jgi:hypothetical protein
MLATNFRPTIRCILCGGVILLLLVSDRRLDAACGYYGSPSQNRLYLGTETPLWQLPSGAAVLPASPGPGIPVGGCTGWRCSSTPVPAMQPRLAFDSPDWSLLASECPGIQSALAGHWHGFPKESLDPFFVPSRLFRPPRAMS